MRESIETLYQIIDKAEGPKEAKQLIEACLSNIIDDLQQENLPVTGEEIEKRLAKLAEDFIYASKGKNDVA